MSPEEETKLFEGSRHYIYTLYSTNDDLLEFFGPGDGVKSSSRTVQQPGAVTSFKATVLGSTASKVDYKLQEIARILSSIYAIPVEDFNFVIERNKADVPFLVDGPNAWKGRLSVTRGA